MPPVAYLDHAATSPLRPEARDAMAPWLGGERWGNPSGSHTRARAALGVLDEARERAARLIGCEAAEVIFTSGGTEADNLAVTGPVLRATDRAAVCSAVEHPAVLEPVRALGGTVVPVDPDGVVDLTALEAAVGAAAAVVSVMAVNNETGVIQPVAEVAAAARRAAPETLVHTDAVQAVGVLDLPSLWQHVDLLSLSGHKFGGPPGSGALAVRTSARAGISPLLRGGPQERELRAGTQNVPAVVGMVAALEAAASRRAPEAERLTALGDRLEDGLVGVDGVVRALGRGVERSGSIRNVRVEGVEAEELLIALDQFGVAASAGSACASGALEPSHVLLAMGRASTAARQHVRFSLGWTTTPDEVDGAVTAFRQAVERLRA